MDKSIKKFKYGKPVSTGSISRPKRRLPQYDEALREFLESGNEQWEIDLASLPSQNPRVVLSSFKWRIRNKPEFRGIRTFMLKQKIYLELEKT
jgi:hypothetical protein